MRRRGIALTLLAAVLALWLWSRREADRARAPRAPAAPAPEATAPESASPRDDGEPAGPVDTADDAAGANRADAGPTPPPAALRVVDDATGAEVAGVTVVANLDWSHEDEVHPAGAERKRTVATGANSPITLPHATGTRTYWARAPGFAWARIAFDHDAGGERTLRLRPGGAAEIALRNYRAGSGTVVRLYGDDDRGARPAVEVRPDGQGRCLVEHLPPDRYDIRVQIGLWFREPRTLGEGHVRVAAAACARVEIDLDDPPARGEPVLVRGTLRVPGEWKKRLSNLDIEPVGPDEAGRDDVVIYARELTRLESGDYAWEAGRLVPGRYVVEADPFQHYQQFTVERGETEHVVAIEVPPPATLTVDFVDDLTGRPARVSGISWHTPFLAGGGSLESLSVEEDTGSFTFQVPLGPPVSVDLSDDRFHAEEQTVRTRGGHNFATMRVVRVCRFRVVVKVGDATLPLGHEFRIDVEHLDGDGEVVARWSDDTTSTFHVTRPGPYRLSFGPLEGYEPLADATVVAEPERVVDVVVRARPRK